MSAPFEALEDRLLRGGIAPRHVKRYLRELDEHLSDITDAQAAAGHDAPTAAARARAALGPDEELADAMLKRRDFRSLSARFPWLVFGVLPVLALSLAVPCHMLALVVLKKLQRASAVPHAGRDGVVHGQFHSGSRHRPAVRVHRTAATPFAGMADPQHRHHPHPVAPLGQPACCGLPSWLQRGPSSVSVFRRDYPRRVHAAFHECLVAADRGAMGDIRRAILC